MSSALAVPVMVLRKIMMDKDLLVSLLTIRRLSYLIDYLVFKTPWVIEDTCQKYSLCVQK